MEVPYQGGSPAEPAENTTIPGTLWDSPIYYEFFAAIRDVNLRQRLSVHSRSCWAITSIGGRRSVARTRIDAYYTAAKTRTRQWLFRQEVVNKKHHALVIYGEGHPITTAPLGANSLVVTSAVQRRHFHNFQQLSR